MCAAPLPDPPTPTAVAGVASRPWLPPLAVGAGLAAACLAVGLSDGEASILPPCPFRELTGLDCPGCGMTRATRQLVRGNLGTALDYNILLVVAIPFIAYLYVRWLASTVGVSLPDLRLGRRANLVAIALLGLFAVVRNLPVGVGRYLNSAP